MHNGSDRWKTQACNRADGTPLALQLVSKKMPSSGFVAANTGAIAFLTQSEIGQGQ